MTGAVSNGRGGWRMVRPPFGRARMKWIRLAPLKSNDPTRSISEEINAIVGGQNGADEWDEDDDTQVTVCERRP